MDMVGTWKRCVISTQAKRLAKVFVTCADMGAVTQMERPVVMVLLSCLDEV